VAGVGLLLLSRLTKSTEGMAPADVLNKVSKNNESFMMSQRMTQKGYGNDPNDVPRGGAGDVDNDNGDDKNANKKKQQLIACSVLAFGVLWDFFVTHKGVGFWSDNYIP